MANIGKIVVRREIKRHLIPPAYEPIIKGPALVTETVPTIVHHAPPSFMGAGGKTFAHKESVHFITQTVAVSDSLVRIKTSGIVGISYTQTSFTFESYTIAGVAVTKTLSQTITISEPLTVQRVKTRSLFEDSPELTQLSSTLSIKRTKTRPIPETQIISDTVLAQVSTQAAQVLTETNAITESVTKLKASRRLQVETVSESGDVTMTLPGISRALSQTVSISDAVGFVVTHAGGINITKTLNDIININEAITRRLENYRTLAQTIAITENLIRLIVTSRKSFSRSFTLVSFTATGRLEKILSESVGESHTLRMALRKARSVPTQSVTLSESLAGLFTPTRTADIVPITDEVVRSVGRSKQLGDTIIISDNLTSEHADVIIITDQVVRVVGRNRSLTQSVTITG